MKPYYYNELPAANFDAEFERAFGMLLLGILALTMIVLLACWSLRAVSLHRIARRRGIRYAWLAWLPAGRLWILGSLADQYQHLIQGRISSRRKLLLWLGLAQLGAGLFQGVLLIGAMILGGALGVAFPIAQGAELLYAAGIILGIVALVFRHICNYDLYRSCDPKNAVAYLVLGVVFPIAEPFFYLSCRKKDLGMIVPEAQG